MEFKTEEQLRNATDEQLRTRLGELRATKRTKTIDIDKDEVMANRYDAMATELGYQDPTTMLELQGKAQQYRDKKEASAQKKLDIDNAIKNLNEISAVWREDPDNKMKQDQVRDAWNRASTLGAKVQNPIDDYLREQFNATQTSIKKEALDQNKLNAEWQRIQDEKRSAREDKKFNLEMAQFAETQKMNASKLAESGTKLNTETIGKVSNLQTVLTSIAEIKGIIDTANQGGISIGDLRDLKYSADLASENLGRVQSGGAITADELVTFRNLISPSLIDIADSGATYLRNVAKLETAINNKISNLQTGTVSGADKPESNKPAVNPDVPTAKGKLVRG